MSALIAQVKRMKKRTPAQGCEFSVVIERDEDGFYVASVPELRGCHTQAKSLDTLMKRVREAIELCLDLGRPETGVRQFVGVQRIRVEA
jgi:predicted RNase H-like HicB family nuclease